MEMNEEYLKRGMDLKRLVLRFQRKIWLLVMMIVLGAVAGGIAYQVVRAIRMPVAYAASSKLYISFHADESGEVYQYYNGYTWNDLLDSDPILDRIMENMATETAPEEVIEATSAEILSDIRLLTITVEGDSEKFVRETIEAVEKGLVAYAQDSEELKRIEVIRSNPSERIFWDDRTTTACVAGAVIMAALTLFIMAFNYVLDEALYTQEDVRKHYPYQALGLLTQNQKGLQPYARELQANIHYTMGEMKTFAILDMGNHADLRRLELERNLNETETDFLSGSHQVGELGWSHMEAENGPEKEAQPTGEYEVIPFNENVLSEEECKKIREIGGVVLMLPFGIDVGRKTERILSLLKNQDCKVLGMIIAQADEEFLNRYYG